MKGLTRFHDKTKHGTWRRTDNMQSLEGLARSVRTTVARNSHGATRALPGTSKASSRAGCTASDATASCAGLLVMLQAMIDKPARNSTRATMASSRPSIQPNVMTSAENKGSGVATSVAMPSPPEPSSDASMEASSDKRTREAPDTTTKPL